MAERCLLYYITDRSAFPGNESARRTRLLEKISEAGTAGVEFIQLREKDLPTRELESLAREAVSVLTEVSTGKRELRTKLLINSRTVTPALEVVQGYSWRLPARRAKEVFHVLAGANLFLPALVACALALAAGAGVSIVRGVQEAKERPEDDRSGVGGTPDP